MSVYSCWIPWPVVFVLGTSRGHRQNPPVRAKVEGAVSTSDLTSQPPPFPFPSLPCSLLFLRPSSLFPSLYPRLPLHPYNHVQEVCQLRNWAPLFPPSLVPANSSLSGLARTFGRAAFARSTPVNRCAFQPIKPNGLPSLTARLASTNAAQVGKIHQVIGAVVDGMLPFRDRAKIFSEPSIRPIPGTITSMSR